MFLLSVMVICALAVITSRHKSRKLFIEMQKEDVLTKKLNVEWGQLQLEQSTWAMHSRIEKEAQHNLGMQVAPPNRTQVILEHGEIVQKPEMKDL